MECSNKLCYAKEMGCALSVADPSFGLSWSRKKGRVGRPRLAFGDPARLDYPDFVNFHDF